MTDAEWIRILVGRIVLLSSFNTNCPCWNVHSRDRRDVTGLEKLIDFYCDSDKAIRVGDRATRDR